MSWHWYNSRVVRSLPMNIWLENATTIQPCVIGYSHQIAHFRSDTLRTNSVQHFSSCITNSPTLMPWTAMKTLFCLQSAKSSHVNTDRMWSKPLKFTVMSHVHKEGLITMLVLLSAQSELGFGSNLEEKQTSVRKRGIKEHKMFHIYDRPM